MFVHFNSQFSFCFLKILQSSKLTFTSWNVFSASEVCGTIYTVLSASQSVSRAGSFFLTASPSGALNHYSAIELQVAPMSKFSQELPLPF